MEWAKLILFFLLEKLGLNKLSRQFNKAKIVVLLYHNIGLPRSVFKNAISSEDFERQLEYLKENFNIVHLDDQGDWVNFDPDRMNVAISFDDGFVNNYENAAPILNKYSLKANFFLISDCLVDGKAPHFEDSGKRTMNVEQAKSLISEGHHIGCHGLTHHDYSMMTVDDALKDAATARQNMREMLGAELNSFAFPWGKHNKEQAAKLSKHFKKIFITEHGINDKEAICLFRHEVDNNYQMYAAASGSLFRIKNIV